MDLSLNKLPWYAQLLLFVLLALAGVGVFYYFYVSPLRLEMAERERRLEALGADINLGMTTAIKLAEFRSQVADLQARLDALRAVLPGQKDVGDLLLQVQTLANESNIRITKFTPLATSTKQLHVEWPIEMTIDGTYHSLATFFDRIAKLSRIINVGEISIRPHANPESGLTINAECTATTFVLVEPAAAAGQPPSGGAQPAPGAGQ